MGWLIRSRQGMSIENALIRQVDDLTRDEHFVHQGVEFDRTCLSHQLTIRSSTEYTLWTVWKVKKIEKGEVTEDTYIGCDLIEHFPGQGLGYKDLCESMGPYYFDCPLEYLEMVPVANQTWRDRVIEFHNTGRRRKPVYVRGRKEVVLC